MLALNIADMSIIAETAAISMVSMGAISTSPKTRAEWYITVAYWKTKFESYRSVLTNMNSRGGTQSSLIENKSQSKQAIT